MPISIRVLVTIAFMGVMFLVKELIIKPVSYAGFIPWLVMMAGIFWLAIKIENKERKRDERPAYSWTEARELITPLTLLAVIIVLAYSYQAAFGH